MVAFATVHSMKEKHSGKCGSMAFKLDMNKAYDWMEWSYLEEVMRTMRFSNKWITLMMKCVRSVSYSVLINGRACGHIKLTKGLRQGDPLSPFLFLLYPKGFSGLLYKAQKEKKIQGMAAVRNGTKVTHMFFANDSLLFCQVKRNECQEILRIMQTYKKVSG